MFIATCWDFSAVCLLCGVCVLFVCVHVKNVSVWKICTCEKCVWWLLTDGHLPYCHCRAKFIHSVQHCSRTSEHPHSATKSQQKCRHCQHRGATPGSSPVTLHRGPQWNLQVCEQKDATTAFVRKKRQAGYSSDLYNAGPWDPQQQRALVHPKAQHTRSGARRSALLSWRRNHCHKNTRKRDRSTYLLNLESYIVWCREGQGAVLWSPAPGAYHLMHIDTLGNRRSRTAITFNQLNWILMDQARSR